MLTGAGVGIRCFSFTLNILQCKCFLTECYPSKILVELWMNVLTCVISNSCTCLRFKGICGLIIAVYIIHSIYNGIYDY